VVGDVDFFELNEAFAAVLAAAFAFLPELPRDRTNQWGSGISLGHPVGATGARQVVDMVHQLRRRGGSLGVTSRCVGRRHGQRRGAARALTVVNSPSADRGDRRVAETIAAEVK